MVVHGSSWVLRITVALLFGWWSPAVNSGPIPWSYRNPANEIIVPDGVTGGLSFPNSGFMTVRGDAIIPATELMSWSGAQAATPDRVSLVPFRFDFELRDDLTQQATLLSLEGTLSGDLWRTGANLTSEFGARQLARLGDREYTIELISMESPTGYGPRASGSLYAAVSVRGVAALEAELRPVETPEPSTLVIVAIGLASVGILFKRYRVCSE